VPPVTAGLYYPPSRSKPVPERVFPISDLYFLMHKFLSGGPLKKTLQVSISRRVDPPEAVCSRLCTMNWPRTSCSQDGPTGWVQSMNAQSRTWSGSTPSSDRTTCCNCAAAPVQLPPRPRPHKKSRRFSV
jgi:hypothetical protein